jgi:hypothetical protein
MEEGEGERGREGVRGKRESERGRGKCEGLQCKETQKCSRCRVPGTVRLLLREVRSGDVDLAISKGLV